MSKYRPDKLHMRQTSALERLMKHMNSTHPHTEKNGTVKDNMNTHAKELAHLKSKLNVE